MHRAPPSSDHCPRYCRLWLVVVDGDFCSALRRSAISCQIPIKAVAKGASIGVTMDKLKEFEPILYPKSLAVIKQGLACPTSVATFNRG